MGLISRKVLGFYKSTIFIFIAAILAFSTLAPLAKVFADSADPIVASSTGSLSVDPNTGNITLTVHGAWQWTTHSSDCNLDRFGVGSAVDWNDPSQPGNVIGTVNGTTVDVGVLNGAGGLNPTDNSVHYLANPAGTINPATGQPYPGTTYCGIYSNPPDYNTGVWGPLSHTYPAGTTSFSACVVTFDIHANEGNGDFPRTPKADHLVATTNNDNSVEANKNTPLGNGCFAVSLPTTLKLVKNVTNDNGGANVPHDWMLTATGGSDGFSDTGDSTTFHPVTAGVGYALSESTVAGYAPGAWSCNGGLLVGSTVTLGPGQNVTCTISNDDVPPSLTLNKIVSNTHGGTAVESNWTLTATGPTTLSGLGAAGSADVVSGPTFSAGTYTLSESGPSGYAASVWTCTNGITVSNNQITLANGQSTVCSVTNSDIAPSLTLNKIVSNTHGGTAVESNWTLNAIGSSQNPTNLMGSGGPGNADVVSGSNFKADTYTLSETNGPNGYAASAWTCTEGVTVTNNHITLANGQSTVCSITNSDIAPILTINKLVLNPYGTALSPNAFPLFVDSTQVQNGVPNTQFNAGNHTVSETQQPHYTLTSGVCDGQNTLSLTLNVGDNKSCTLTNTAIQPKLTVIKHVINDSGGSKEAKDFTMHISNNSANPADFPGNEAGTMVGLNEGSYSVDELSHVGYTETMSEDCSGTISIGETKTCTITNDDILPPQHGIGFAKGCESPTVVGDPYKCAYKILNIVDTAHDTQEISSLVDVTHSAGGDVNSGNILSQVYLVSEGGATCTGPGITGDGTAGNPYHGATSCLLPFGATLTVQDFSYYTTTQADYDNLPGHHLPDSATLTFTDQCDDPTHIGYPNCNPNPQETGAGSQTLLVKLGINVEKSGPSVAFAGDTVTYHFVVTNTGDVPLSALTVNDDVAGIGTYQSGDDGDGILQTDESWFYSKDFVVPANQSANVVNTVTACGSYTSHQVCDTDDHTLIVFMPSIHVVKSGPSSAAAGSTVTYTFTVTNTGNIPLSDVTVNDNIAGAGTYQSGDTNNNHMLDLTETWIYTAQYTIPAGQTASINNTATACGDVVDQEQELDIQSLDEAIDSHQVCATDTHTLTIPQVLAATTTKPAVLVTTGQNALIGIFAGLFALGLTGAVTAATRQNRNTKI